MVEKTRVLIKDRYHHIISTLQKLAEASIKMDNPIVWC